MSSTPGARDYALAPSLRARGLGLGLVTLGVMVAAFAAVAVLTSTGVLIAFAAGLALVGVAGLGALVGVRRWVLRLDDDGYQVRGIRSAGVRRARWSDVKDLQATTVAGSRCVLLRLRDGGATTIPVDVLEGGPDELADELSARLDRGHGYRRIR